MVYVVGPLANTEIGRAAKEQLFDLIRNGGYEPVDYDALEPTRMYADPTYKPTLSPKRRACEIILNRMRPMVMLAVLEGADIDSVTASEIGFAMRDRRIIVAYRSDERASLGMQSYLDLFIMASGGSIVTKAADIVPAIDAAYEVFNKREAEASAEAEPRLAKRR